MKKECKIIAVDFDGTLCENRWPEIGEANEQLIEYLKTEKSKGSKLILWTNRTEDKLSEAIKWCRNYEIEFDAVNDNLPEMIEFFGNNPRKIFANEYIDDHNKLIRSCNVSRGKSWAQQEVEVASNRERELNDTEDSCFDYGCACYESALRAYESLCDDGHTGFSIGLTANILNRLIRHKPLTPIEDTEDVWYDSPREEHDNYSCHQCKRMSSLFKYVYDDGTIRYTDVDRVRCHTIDNSNGWYSNGFITHIIDEMYPIVLPYYPSMNSYEVITEEFLTDSANGDFDTLGILYVVLPNHEKVTIERYFKDSECSFEEISVDEYEERRKLAEGLKNEGEL